MKGENKTKPSCPDINISKASGAIKGPVRSLKAHRSSKCPLGPGLRPTGSTKTKMEASLEDQQGSLVPNGDCWKCQDQRRGGEPCPPAVPPLIQRLPGAQVPFLSEDQSRAEERRRGTGTRALAQHRVWYRPGHPRCCSSQLAGSQPAATGISPPLTKNHSREFSPGNPEEERWYKQ